MSNICSDMGVNISLITDEIISEMVRFGGSEPHTTAAYIGGVLAQEAIKFITNMYVPLNNTFIFDGIACKGATFQA